MVKTASLERDCGHQKKMRNSSTTCSTMDKVVGATWQEMLASKDVAKVVGYDGSITSGLILREVHSHPKKSNSSSTSIPFLETGSSIFTYFQIHASLITANYTTPLLYTKVFFLLTTHTTNIHHVFKAKPFILTSTIILK